ncbi:MAG: glycosyl transferase, family 51 [Frankiales bacterium]|nr:glycosyl transferase, family 51 [Frankiales bacterium]
MPHRDRSDRLRDEKSGHDGRVNRWRQWSLRKKILSGAGAFGLLLVLLGVLGYVLTDLPQPSQSATNQASSIRYSDGSEIGRVGTDNRKLVPLSEVSDPAQKAVLAAEDRGFYSEPGISPRGIFRALVANLKGGSVQQGGSTITQQYAKNAYLTQQRTFSRKIKEFFISLKLAHKLSKNQILENYLNTIYFGRGASGIEVAARTYFNKPAKDLTVAEGAVLAASIRSPAGYDPARHRSRAEARWNYVLDGMVKKGWLSKSERAGITYPKVLAIGEGGSKANDRSGPNGFVLDQVEEELARHGFTEDRLAAGGYVVQTTIRRHAQEAAIAAMKALPDPKLGDKSAVQGALVAVHPGSGEVYAYYGGRNGNKGFDYASSGKGVQPGSSFKPFTLATALDQGIGLGTRVDGSSPQTIGGQLVHNDEGDPSFGQIDLVTATQYSVNTAYYNLAKKVGVDSIADVAHRAGIPDGDTLRDEQTGGRGLGITLGIYPVHVIDQAAAYATFAGKGEAAKPFFVKTVTDRDKNRVYSAKQVNNRAFSADVAADATYAMQQVVKGGTGTRAQLNGRPTAGKTGTTSENRNAWFCGFTPQLAAAVWVGRGDGSPLKGVLGSSRGIYGGTVPAEIWKAFMDAALQGQPVMDFPPKANVGRNVDTSSGPSGSFSPAPTTSSSPSPLPSIVASLLPTQAPPSDAPSPSDAPPSPSDAPPSPQPSASPPPPAASPAASP